MTKYHGSTNKELEKFEEISPETGTDLADEFQIAADFAWWGTDEETEVCVYEVELRPGLVVHLSDIVPGSGWRHKIEDNPGVRYFTFVHDDGMLVTHSLYPHEDLRIVSKKIVSSR